jgi:sulfopyruvate decarboxylase subunit beta
MIKRQVITKLLSEYSSADLKIVSCLGRISRDMYFFSSDAKRQHCLFNVGAMGSTLPFAIGIALVKYSMKIWAIEGDGSILMNLGGLVTYKRYNPKNLTLFILDNRQYETTGGQVSQPDNFDLSDVCRSVGLTMITIEDVGELKKLIKDIVSNTTFYEVIIIKTLPDEVSPRIIVSPHKLTKNFVAGFEKN